MSIAAQVGGPVNRGGLAAGSMEMNVTFTYIDPWCRQQRPLGHKDLLTHTRNINGMDIMMYACSINGEAMLPCATCHAEAKRGMKWARMQYACAFGGFVSGMACLALPIFCYGAHSSDIALQFVEYTIAMQLMALDGVVPPAVSLLGLQGTVLRIAHWDFMCIKLVRGEHSCGVWTTVQIVQNGVALLAVEKTRLQW